MKYSSEEIGKTIKNERLKKKWSQDKLGDKIGVSGKQISNYEKGTPTPPIDVLFTLCEIFECELGYLLGEADYRNGTKINTAIEKILGINTDSIDALRHITGNERRCLNFGYESDSYRRIINSLFCEPSFSYLIESLYDLDSCIYRKNKIWKDLEEKYDKNTLDKAFEYYNSTIDYIHDENAEKLPNIYYQAIADIDSSIDNDHDSSFPIKVQRYEARESFERVLNSLYPVKNV